MYYLQSRWKLKGSTLIYYGMRKEPYLLQNQIKVNKKQVKALAKLPLEPNSPDLTSLQPLINQGIIVEEKDLRSIPKSLDEAIFCHNCSANDFMIPGIEFDEKGLCPMCASSERTKHLKSVLPLMEEIPVNPKGRFDVALFYTGGKDSTFLLYYLAKIKKMRVLALTWEIPYMSDSARASIQNAKIMLPTVEFITRQVAHQDLAAIYHKLYQISENTCCCPSLAYILFYPELVNTRVPYFVAGNEPAQIKNLFYNNMAPPIAYKYHQSKTLKFLLNVMRIMTLRKPFKPGQFETLTTMKQLTRPKTFLRKFVKYRNELLENVCLAIQEVPDLLKPLKRAIRYSSRTGNIPAFIHIDFNDINNGVYDWREIKDTLIKEVGWVAPSVANKGLHTSCQIEKCKEYSQFKRFYEMKSTMIPFSAIELALATQSKALSKEEAIQEIKEAMGFSLQEVPECAIMRDYINRYKKSSI